MRNVDFSTKVFRLLMLVLLLFSVQISHADGGWPKTVKGRIVDAKSGETLIGVNIQIKGTTTGTISDFDGGFQLTVKANSVLQFSYVGYKSIEMKAEEAVKRTVFKMQEDASVLEEVVVVGYGVQKKVTNVGSITQADGLELMKSGSVNSVSEALQGKLNGVIAINSSGKPGDNDVTMYIRGKSTWGNTNPLVLVDGIERDMDDIDMNEIETISVLKDASATAVYGVRGGNGVILITTKRGTDNSPEINFSANVTFKSPTTSMHLADHVTAMQAYNRGLANDGSWDKLIPLSTIEAWQRAYEEGNYGAYNDVFPYVNWWDELVSSGYTQNYNVNIRGGTGYMKYFASVGYQGDGDIYNLKENDAFDPRHTYKRYNWRSNFDFNITSTTKLSVNVAGKMAYRNKSLDSDNPFNRIMTESTSDHPVKYSDGYWGDYEEKNPVANMNLAGANLRKTFQGWYDASLEQKLDFITPGLSMNIKGAYNTNYNVKASRTPSGADSMCTPIYLGSIETPGMDFWDPRFDRTIVYQTDGVSGLHEQMSYGEEVGRGRNWYGEFSLNYSRSFGDHDVSALFLYNQSKKYYPETKIDGKVFYMDIPTAYVGYVGRMTYAYKKRYMVDLNAGYNGSENFAPDKRFGFFPAVSAGWILSEEKFMKKQKVIDFLKLRASYGIVGNDKMENARFLYMAGAWSGYNTVAKGQGSWQFGKDGGTGLLPDAKENTMGNPDVTWEKVAKQNYGIDLKMFDSRLSLTADVFFEKRKDILSTRNTLPAITDINLPKINLGKVNNHGYELSLGWNDRAGKVDYWLKANVSYAKNKIIYMDEVVPNEPYMAETGRSTGLTYGYIFDRFLQKDDFDADGNLKKDENGRQILPQMALGTPRPGDALFKDLNGDGVINGDDKTRFGYAERPDYVFGFLGGLKWKNFEFSMQWTAAMNASRILDGEYRNAFGSTNSRMLLKFLADGRWTEENPNSRFPRLTFMNKSHYLQTSDLWLMNGSYLRLKTAEISYTLPQKDFLKKVGIESVRFYCNGYNLLTLFSDLNDIDIDPEGVTDGGNNNYPNIRIYNFGVNISFYIDRVCKRVLYIFR